MSPIAVIDLVAALACLTAVVILVRGWKRPRFLPAVPILLLTLLALMTFYYVALFLQWSGFTEKLEWLEDITGVFIPFTWAFVFYAVVKNAVEEDLEASREHFRDLVESTSDWIWEMDAAGRYTYASPHVEAVLGYTPDEIVGRTPFDLMSPAEAARVSAIFAEIIEKQGNFRDLENVNLHKDGHEVVLETNGVPIFGDKGKLIGYRGIDRDITQRQETERLQKQQQAELESVFRASPAGIGLIRNRKMVRGNKRFFEITGYSESEQIGKDPRRYYLSEQDYVAVGEKYTEALAEGFARIETQFIRKDQAVIDVVLYFSPLDADDADKGFVVVTQDITEYKAAQRQAMAEKTRAQLYLDVAGVMIVVLGAQGRVKLINKKGCEVLDRSAEQIEGLDWFKAFLPPSYQQITRSLFERIMSSEAKTSEYFENPVCTLSGVEKLIAWHNTALRDESGRVVGMISSGEDITATRAAQEAIRQSDERLRVALSAARMGTWRWEVTDDRDTRDINLNSLLGLEAVETTQTINDFFNYVHPEDRAAAKKEFERAMRERDTYLARFRIVQPDGRVRWVLDQGKPFYDQNGKLDYMTGVVVDITEQIEYQHRYQNIIDSAPMGILTYELEADDRLVLTGANRAANTILGVSFSLSIGKRIEEVFPELVETPLPDEFRRICKQGGVYHGDNFQYRDARVSGFYEFDAFQTSSGNVAVAFTDVTERKVAEQTREQLMQQLQFTQFAVDHGGDAAYWMGPDAKFIYVNDLACQSLGYTRQELLSMTVHDIDPDFPAETWGDHWNEMRQKKIMWFESHHKKKDGRVFPVEITTNFVKYDAAEYNCAFARDITERKVAEQKREVLMQQVQNRNDELQSIVFTAAHDLRSPLVNIAGFTGELEKGLAQLIKTLDGAPLDADVAERVDFLLKTDLPESLRFVKFGNQHMDMLLGGLMRLSRVGSAPMKLVTLNMNELFDSIVRGFQYQINTLDIDVSIQENLPSCTGDYSLLAQVFINLLDNAIKYRHPDRAAVIEIGARLRGDMAEYTVSDNGIGIEPEQVEKVFDLFYQLDRKPDPDGEGLGLTIVRRILDRLHGSVRIESTPGLGTTVYIQLPKA